MDPFTIGALIQGAGTVAGMIQGDRDARAQRDRIAQAVSIVSGIPVLELEKYTPEELINMGNFSPEELQAIGVLGPSAFENIQTDPRLRADQEMALGQARERALRGFTAEDAAMLDQYMRQASNTAQSATQGALNDAARRGMAGSGNALAAALQGSQSAANLQSQQAMQQAAMRLQAQDRNTDALARMAAGLDATDYSRASDLATRRDSIEQFNQSLRQQVAGTNVANRNTANLRNLNQAQSISDQNVGIRNDAQLREQDRQKALFDAEFKRRTAIANAMSGQATALAEMDKNKTQGISNMIGGVGGFLQSNTGQNLFNKLQDNSTADVMVPTKQGERITR